METNTERKDMLKAGETFAMTEQGMSVKHLFNATLC